jgi:hypothetical protein
MKLENTNLIIQQHWPVNIFMENVDISDEENQELIRIGIEHSKEFKHIPDILDPNRKGYNLLEVDHPVIHKFREYIKSRTLMMMHAEGFINPEKYEIEAVAAARQHEHGDRSKTHNHRGCDYVGVYYADLDVVNTPGEDNFRQPKGRLILTDPISQRSRALNHTMCLDLVPTPKFFIMHPAYLFHQSEPYLGQKTRYFFTVVIRIAEPIQHPFYKKI